MEQAVIYAFISGRAHELLVDTMQNLAESLDFTHSLVYN